MHSTQVIGFSDEDGASLRTTVDEIVALDAVIAAAEAARTRALSRAGMLARGVTASQRASVRAHDMVLRSIAAEIATASRTSDRSVQRQIGEAMLLTEDFPQTLAAWEDGLISRAHVRTVTDAGVALPPESRAEFDTLAALECQDTTPARAKARLQRLAEQLHPRTLTERHVEACETRGIRVVPGSDGMSEVIATVPSIFADAIYDRLTQQARQLIDFRTTPPAGIDAEQAEILASDTRTIDQIRADLLADMLLTSVPGIDPTRDDDGPGTLGAIRAKVQVIVPVLALLGDDSQLADLVGRSPIDADTARRLAGATPRPWDRILTHPITGAVLHTDTYQRTRAIDRHVQARDQHCRFPGCRIPAIRCEIDHTHDYALGGTTTVTNLGCLCQRHHSMKQFTAWTVVQRPGGILEWTSPLGTVISDTPPPIPGNTVRFVPADDGVPAF